MSLPRYASLDVGSNTVRLLIAERKRGREIHPLQVERNITRLGGNFSAGAGLDPGAMARTLETLKAYADLLKRQGVKKVFAVATGVLREAVNGKAFLDLVFQHTGLPLRLVSGEEEARLALKGVLWSLADRTPWQIIADIGGWSTEVLWVQADRPRKTSSLPLGAVALTERFLKSDPPKSEELAALEGWTGRILREIREVFEKDGLQVARLHPQLVGTAGTMTTLASIDQGLLVYDPQKINGHQISRFTLEKMARRLGSIPIQERQKIAGLEKGREDLIVAGIVVVLKLLEVFELERLLVIDSGLLEGILLDGLEQIAHSS